ncbi:MAG: site-specific integrase [Planctomycetota bacterium]
MTVLRRRMIEDMQLAGLSEGTQKRYLTGVACLARAYNRSPDRISEEEVRRHVLHLRDERGVARGTFQTHWHGIRFFYERTLGLEWGLFSKKKWASLLRSVFPWPAPTRSAAGCCRT